MTGCRFAQLLAGKTGRVAVELRVDAEIPLTEWLNNTFDVHAKAERTMIAVLPTIASERALVETLNELGADPRWSVRRRPKPSPTGGILVGLEWRTRAGDLSEAMGFAPFATMPVPRRAPYVAIATWPAGRSNPFRGQGSTPPGRPGEVSFLDASHGFDAEQYEAMWSETTSRVGALMTVPPDDPRLYRRAAFVLSAEHAANLVTG
jgi:hypothetical protein